VSNYPIDLTGAQLRVLHEVVALVMNDPTWPMSHGDRTVLGRAGEKIAERWRDACRAESTPA
jgi:hypothetical protein